MSTFFSIFVCFCVLRSNFNSHGASSPFCYSCVRGSILFGSVISVELLVSECGCNAGYHILELLLAAASRPWLLDFFVYAKVQKSGCLSFGWSLLRHGNLPLLHRVPLWLALHGAVDTQLALQWILCQQQGACFELIAIEIDGTTQEICQEPVISKAEMPRLRYSLLSTRIRKFVFQYS